MSDFEKAWSWRDSRGLLKESEALRVFHGPGEGEGASRQIAIDRFKDHYWVTEWEIDRGAQPRQIEKSIHEAVEFLKTKSAQSVVLLARPEKGIPSEPRVLFGRPPKERFAVCEYGAQFMIQLTGARHPGLFLDHAPLRQWLRARSRDWKVLNTFAYTGSLSVAAGLGGAAHVTTLDLSKATMQWAEENWVTNGFSAIPARFIAGDVFEWLPRLKREDQRYDCVILDPPSFSRGKKGNFSTAKDLKRLHSLALALLSPGGVLVTSINSANVNWSKYEADVLAAAKESGISLEILWQIGLPETFPTLLGIPSDRYLKGWVFRARA